MTKYSVEIEGMKMFKTRIQLTAEQYEDICIAGENKDHARIRRILTHEVGCDLSDDAVKLRRIEVDVYDHANDCIAADLDL